MIVVNPCPFVCSQINQGDRRSLRVFAEWLSRLLYQGAMGEFAPPLCIVHHNLPGTPELPLVDHQTFQPHGAAGVDLTGTDAHLGAQPVAIAVTKASAAVPQHIA